MSLPRNLFVISLALFVVGTASHVAWAVLVTFDDAAGLSPYTVGDTFTSEGVDFEVDVYNPAVGTTLTIGANLFGTSPGTDPVAYPNNVNMDIDFVGSVGRQGTVSIQLTDNGGTVNLHINGDQADIPQSAPNFLAFDGTVINGVSVSYFDLSGIGAGRARLDLAGPIDRVVIGGQESIFDDIRTTPIPEPSTLTLGVLFIAIARVRGHRRM